MKKHCLACQKEFTGRSDKRFCSAACKNGFNNAKRKSTRDAVREVDGFLHWNREILATVMGGHKKLTLTRLVLDQAGFRWKYCTGTYLNKEGKTYFIVYDYAWMEFSNQEVLLVRGEKAY